MAASGTARTALITGSTSGIGREMAHQLAAKGWRILITGRETSKGNSALEYLQARFPGADHRLWIGDLADLDHVQALAQWAQTQGVDVLLNNVGGAFAAGTPLRNGLSATFLTNLVSPYLLTRLMLGSLHQQADPRIIFMSSTLHYYSDASPVAFGKAQHSDGPLEYGVVKLAAMAWLHHLAREMTEHRIAMIAADPGIADTDNFSANYKGLTGAVLRAFWLTYPDFKTKRDAAKPGVLAASDARFEGGCTYIGPDGKPQPFAKPSLDLAFGRRVEEVCKSICSTWMGD